MKLFCVLLITLYSLISSAQVGIGKVNPNFILDINASTLNLNGINLDQVGFNAQFLAENSTSTLVFNNSLTTGLYNYRFGGVTRYIMDNTSFRPAVNSNDNLTALGLDIGRFDFHFRRVYAQGIHTNDDNAAGGLRINIGAGGGVNADYIFSDFSLYPVLNQNKLLGRNTNFWLSTYSVNYFVPSDTSLKNNINPNIYGLNTIKNLKTYSYNYKAEKSKNLHFGFMAQELKEILPNLVDTPVNGDGPLAVNYIEVVPVLVKAIQEQNELIETQALKIEKLEAEISLIKKKLGL